MEVQANSELNSSLHLENESVRQSDLERAIKKVLDMQPSDNGQLSSVNHDSSLTHSVILNLKEVQADKDSKNIKIIYSLDSYPLEPLEEKHWHKKTNNLGFPTITPRYLNNLERLHSS